MSDGLVCDGCGDALLADSDVRYILETRGYAAYDPMEIGPGRLEEDHRAEMARLIELMNERSAEELEHEVHRSWCFDLCPECWKRYQRDPLLACRREPGTETTTSGETTPED